MSSLTALAIGKAVSSDVFVTVTEPWQECRLGFVWATNDDATDTTTAQEQLSAQVIGRLGN